MLSAIRGNVPDPVGHSVVPLFEGPGTTLKADSKSHLVEGGGQAHEVANRSQATAMLARLHPRAKVICSRRIDQGAVLLTQEDPVVDALALLSRHLVVRLDPKEVVREMHEPYRRVQLYLTAHGCFIMGPSAAADVEATLVHGAQGARSLNVVGLPRS